MVERHRFSLQTFNVHRMCLALLQRLRRPSPPVAPPVQPVVDLVGGDEADAPQRLPAIAGSGAYRTGHPPAEAWSFKQPVLLRRSSQASTVIVWSAVGGTGLLILWSLLAPWEKAWPCRASSNRVAG